MIEWLACYNHWTITLQGINALFRYKEIPENNNIIHFNNTLEIDKKPRFCWFILSVIFHKVGSAYRL
jgi:hypothetical protein